jgi:hypothetical protein
MGAGEREGMGRGGSTYCEGKEAETEEDAGVADEWEDVHYLDSMGSGGWVKL